MTFFQRPNPPLIVAIVAFIVFAIGQGVVLNGGLVVFALSMSIWAWEEIRRGANWFRKSLGYAALSGVALLLFLILSKV